MPDESSICDDTLRKNPHSYTTAQWRAKRAGRLSITTDWYANNKAALEKLCHLTKDCVEEVVAHLEAKAARMIKHYGSAQ